SRPPTPSWSRGCSRSSPCRACLTRLPAASVTTRATLPQSVSSKPSRAASAVASRRASPAWLASVTGRVTATGSLPPGYDNPCAFSDPRGDVDPVDQALRAPQAEPQARPGRVAVLEGQVDVGNAGPGVLERQPESAAAAVINGFEPDAAA